MLVSRPKCLDRGMLTLPKLWRREHIGGVLTHFSNLARQELGKDGLICCGFDHVLSLR